MAELLSKLFVGVLAGEPLLWLFRCHLRLSVMMRGMVEAPHRLRFATSARFHFFTSAFDIGSGLLSVSRTQFGTHSAGRCLNAGRIGSGRCDALTFTVGCRAAIHARSCSTASRTAAAAFMARSQSRDICFHPSPEP